MNQTINMNPDDANKRISTGTKWLMLSVALLVDILEALISFTGIGMLTGAITTTFSWLLFTPWFWMHGVSFTRNTDHLNSTAFWYIMGWIPIIGALPEFTIGVYRNIKIAENEDIENQEEQQSQMAARARARTQKESQQPRFANTNTS